MVVFKAVIEGGHLFNNVYAPNIRYERLMFIGVSWMFLKQAMIFFLLFFFNIVFIIIIVKSLLGSMFLFSFCQSDLKQTCLPFLQ